MLFCETYRAGTMVFLVAEDSPGYPKAQPPASGSFDEAQWLKMLFLVSDTQGWLTQLQADLLFTLPIKNRGKLLKRSYFLSAGALAHLLERHYYKIHRHPHAGKFTIPVADIVSCIRDAEVAAVLPVDHSPNQQRMLDTRQPIGIDRQGNSTSLLTVVTDPGGKIITAFPGMLE